MADFMTGNPYLRGRELISPGLGIAGKGSPFFDFPLTGAGSEAAGQHAQDHDRHRSRIALGQTEARQE